MAPAMPCKRDKEYSSIVKTNVEQKNGHGKEFKSMYGCMWNPTSLRDREQMKPSLNSTQKYSNHVFLLKQLKIYCDDRNLTRIQWRGPTTWKEVLKKCVGRYCEFADKKVEQLYKSFTPLFGRSPVQKRRSLNQLENCQKFAHKLSLKFLVLGTNWTT